MTRAMLLCAGLSTRLESLAAEVPKPLLPVCDVPILRYGIAHLVGCGIRDIVINTHHMRELIEREIGDGAELGARVSYSHEADLLGTGGGLRQALPLLDPDDTDEPFVSMNGKLIFDVNLPGLLAAYAADPDALGMLVCRKVADARDWGALDVAPDEAGRLRVRDVFGEGDYMFCGVHVTRPSVVKRLPAGPSCSIRQGYLPWLQAGEPVAAFVHESGYFAEHSTPARYLESNIELLRGQKLSHPPGRLHGVDERAHIAPTAMIHHPVRIGAGAHIGDNAVVGPLAVVGAHAIVAQDTVVERSIVWRGGRAHGVVRDSIVTPRQTVKIQL